MEEIVQDLSIRGVLHSRKVETHTTINTSVITQARNLTI